MTAKPYFSERKEEQVWAFSFLFASLCNKLLSTFILVKIILIIQYSCHKIIQAFLLKFRPATTCIKPPLYLHETLKLFFKTSNAL